MKLARFPIVLQVKCKDGRFRNAKEIGLATMSKSKRGFIHLSVFNMFNGRFIRFPLIQCCLFNLLLRRHFIKPICMNDGQQKKMKMNNQFKAVKPLYIVYLYKKKKYKVYLDNNTCKTEEVEE